MRPIHNLADSGISDSLANTMRRRRFQHVLDLIESCPKRSLRILDVGGTEQYWEMMGFVDAGHEITVLNLTREEPRHKNIITVAGDARSMPQFADNEFDIVFSNSVIEHMDCWESQQRMAAEIRRLARKYYVQTPNYWFPVEPHFLVPAFQYMPFAVRVWMVQHCRLGWKPDEVKCYEDARNLVANIRLLTKRQVATLFPDAEILPERFHGLTKSLMAIRQ